MSDRGDTDLLAAARRLRVVANVAVGYDNIDVAPAEARGVIVTTSTRRRMASTAVDNVAAVAGGHVPPNPVTQSSQRKGILS